MIFGDVNGKFDDERGALTGLGFNADAAAHRFGEALADREAQTGSAKTPARRFIALGKRRKELLLHLARNTDAGIGHGEYAR